MTTPLDLLERVMPWPGPSGPGWVNLHWKLTVTGQDGKPRPAWRGQPFKEPGPLLARAQRLCMDVTKAEDLYFCLSVQAQCDQWTLKDGRVINIAKRDAPNATLLKALWLDVDVKTPPKGYTDPKEARRAIIQFCTDAKLPLPSALVNSGSGGVHVYWISDKPLTVDEWRPYAEGLRAEADRLGLRCDLGVTTDCARILRVPGTFNRKIKGQDRPVVVTSLGVDYNFEKDLAHLKTIGAARVTATVTAAPPFDLSKFAGQKMHPLLAADDDIKAAIETGNGGFTGIDRWSDLPLKVDNVIRECGHFQDAALNKGKGHSQGLWMQTVLASTWLENGYRWAKEFSKGYAGFDKTEGELKAMWERKLADREKDKLGWPGCKAFENEGCTACKTCKWRGQIKSPLSLADRVQPEEPKTTVVVNPVTQTVMDAQALGLPNGYSLTNGHIYAMVTDKANPTGPKIPLQILEGQIISRPRVVSANPPTFYFKYKHGDNFMEVSFPFTAMTTDQKMIDALHECGVHICLNAEKHVRAFMRSFSSKIDLAIKRLHSAPLGWVYDNGARIGFAYGGVLYKMDGTEEESSFAQNVVTKNAGPCGEIGPIYECMEIISEQNHPQLEILTLQSWVSALVDISGLASTSVMWGFSPAGAHKSMALQTGCAVWYHPVILRERGGATVIGLENKMDLLRSLPCVLDEMTNDAEIDSVVKIFNRIMEGGAGSRGTRTGGVREPKHWQLALACGANTSLYEYFDRKNEQTDAKAVRIFELPVDKRNGKRVGSQVDAVVGSLKYNYGHLGVAYAKYLTANYNALKAQYDALATKVRQDLADPETGRCGDEERFWLASVALTLLACNVANEVTGKKFFHFDQIKQELYKAFRRNRQWVRDYVQSKGTAIHTSEAWGKLTRLWINNQLATDRMAAGNGRPTVGTSVKVFMRPPVDRGQPVLMHWVQNPPMLRVAQLPLTDALVELGYGLGVFDKLRSEYGGKLTRKTFMAGLPVQDAKSRISVWEIPITDGHPLYDEWASAVQHEPATAMSAAAMAQDVAPVTAAVTDPPKAPSDKIAAAMAQAAKDLEKQQ